MMASACVNSTGTSPEPFLDCLPACPSYGWLGPRISFSRDIMDDGPKAAVEKPEAGPVPAEPSGNSEERSDPDACGKDLADFEFRPDDPVAMLPADELFSGGKLVPLQLAAARPVVEPVDEIRSPEPLEKRRAEILRSDASAISPKVLRCSSRWRELLGLKRPQQQGSKPEHQNIATVIPSKKPNSRSLKRFLHRGPKSSWIDASLSLPLLRDCDPCDPESESVSVSSRRSLSSSSSSSSGPDHEDLPRLSLDTDKPSQNPISLSGNLPRVRASRPRSAAPSARAGRSPVQRAPDSAAVPAPQGASVDSPRMNASGRVVFQGLERSSSSPGTFNGGSRVRHRGMERSYSAGVRVAPVLNVSVSVFGLGQLFKKEREGAGAAARSGGGIRSKSERARARA